MKQKTKITYHKIIATLLIIMVVSCAVVLMVLMRSDFHNNAVHEQMFDNNVSVINNTAGLIGEVSLLNEELHNVSVNENVLQFSKDSSQYLEQSTSDISDMRISAPETKNFDKSVDQSVECKVDESDIQNIYNCEIKQNNSKNVKLEKYAFQVVESASKIVYKSAQTEVELENSESQGDFIKSNKLQFTYKTHNNVQFLVINATETGVVWFSEDEINALTPFTDWSIMESTKNNWQNPVSKSSTTVNNIVARENICPIASNYNVFGVRPNKTTRVPVLYAVQDANYADQLTIKGELTLSDEDFATFHIIDGKYVDVQLGEYSKLLKKRTQIKFNVTDFGTYLGEACATEISITLEVHDYLQQNSRPIKVGRQASSTDLTSNGRDSLIEVSVLDGWVDPDGDDMITTLVTQSMSNDVQSNESEYTSSETTSNAFVYSLTPDGCLSATSQQNLSQNSEHKVNVFYKINDVVSNSAVIDDYNGVLSHITLIFDNNAKPRLQTVNLFGYVNEPIEFDFVKAIQNIALPLKIEFVNIPPELNAAINQDDHSVKLIANTAAVYQLEWKCVNNELCKNLQNNGILNLNIGDKKQQNAQKTNTLFIKNETDKNIKLCDLFSTPYYLHYNIKNVKINKIYQNSSLFAQISADSTLHLDAYLLENSNSSFINIGEIFINYDLKISDSIENTEKQDVITEIGEYFAKFTVILINENESNKYTPMAHDAQIVATPGQIVTLSANDLVSNSGAQTGINGDNQTNSEVFFEDLSLNNTIISNHKMRYFVPKNAIKSTLTDSVNSEINNDENSNNYISVKYMIYNSNCYESCRIARTIYIKIINAQINDLKYAKSVEQIYNENVYEAEKYAKYTKSAESTIPIKSTQTTQNTASAVGLRDIYFGNNGNIVDKSVFNPLQNDIIDDGLNVKMKKAVLINNETQINDESQSAAIFEPQDIAKKKTVLENEQLNDWLPCFGESGEKTYWELTTETFSNGENPKYGEFGTKVGSYTQRIALISVMNKPIASNDVLEKFVQIENIAQDESFEIAVNDQKFNGKISENAEVYLLNDKNLQMLDFPKASDFADNSIKTIIYAPSLSMLKPVRIDNKFKTVVSGEELVINLQDEIKKSNIWSSVFSQSSIQKNDRCILENDILRYSAPEINENDDLIDSCDVNAVWQGINKVNEKSNVNNSLSFKILVIPRNVKPKFVNNSQFSPLAPNESQKINLADYIIWWGHSREQIQQLRAICEQNNTTDIYANCMNLDLSINVSKTAHEQINCEIKVELYHNAPHAQESGQNDQMLVNSIFIQPIKLGVKYNNIEIPPNETTLIIEEGKEVDAVNVLDEVKKWLDQSAYYGFQSGGEIKCSNIQPQFVKCEELTNVGSLRFTVNGAQTGFYALGNYTFSDRAPSANTNYGSGKVRIEYRALPFSPSIPQVDYALAREGIVSLDVMQLQDSTPKVSEICIIAQKATRSAVDEAVEKCVRTNQSTNNELYANSITFDSANSLAFMENWQQYEFSAYAKNSVGASPLTSSVVTTKFNKISQPQMRIVEQADNSVILNITKPIDYEFVSVYEIRLLVNNFEIYVQTNYTSDSNSLEITLHREDLHALNNVEYKVSLRAISAVVQCGEYQFVASYSDPFYFNIIFQGEEVEFQDDNAE